MIEAEAREIARRRAFSAGAAMMGFRQMNAIVTAFAIGWELGTHLANWWYQMPGGASTGPDLSGWKEECRIGTGSFWDDSQSACGRSAWRTEYPVQQQTIGHSSGRLSEWAIAKDPFIENGVSYWNSMVVAGFSSLGGPDFIYRPQVQPDVHYGVEVATPPIVPYRALPYALAFAHPMSIGGEPSLPVAVTYREPLPSRPGRRKKERKVQLGKGGWAGAVMNVATESLDAIDDLFDALPDYVKESVQDLVTFTRKDGTTFQKWVDRFPLITVYEKELIRGRDGKLREVNTNVIKYQFRSEGSGTDRARTVYQNASQVNVAKALKNLALSQAQDAVYGKTTQATNKALVKNGWSSARGFSIPK